MRNCDVKVVLFDLDDTLFDHLYALGCGVEAVWRSRTNLYKQPLETLQRDFRRMSGDVWPLVLKGQMTVEESQDERLRRLFVQYGEPYDAVQVSTAGEHYRAAYARSQQPVAGVVTLLQRLKRMTQIGIVTNNLTTHQHTKLRICQIDHLIDFMVTSEDTGMSKPDPAIFAAALRRANCSPQEAVMIGDSRSADVLGAHAAGIRAIWLNRMGEPFPDPAIAVEIMSLEPVETVVQLIFGEH